MKRLLKLIAYYAYIITFVLTSAGAINYGASKGGWVFIVFGILNIVYGAYNAYVAAKTKGILDYEIKRVEDEKNN